MQTDNIFIAKFPIVVVQLSAMTLSYRELCKYGLYANDDFHGARTAALFTRCLWIGEDMWEFPSLIHVRSSQLWRLNNTGPNLEFRCRDDDAPFVNSRRDINIGVLKINQANFFRNSLHIRCLTLLQSFKEVF